MLAHLGVTTDHKRVQLGKRKRSELVRGPIIATNYNSGGAHRSAREVVRTSQYQTPQKVDGRT